MSRKHPNPAPPTGVQRPTPPPDPPVQQEIKLERIEQANVVSHVAPLSDRITQDRFINAMDAAGYVHYESLPIGGNEIILRFRKK